MKFRLFLCKFGNFWLEITVELYFCLQEIQAHYDEIHRQLQVTVDQYGQAQRRLQSLTAELEEVRINYETVSTI